MVSPGRRAVATLGSFDGAVRSQTLATRRGVRAVDPDRFVTCCSVDPVSGLLAVVEGDADGIEADSGSTSSAARGFGEVKCGLPIDGDRLQRVYGIREDIGPPRCSTGTTSAVGRRPAVTRTRAPGVPRPRTSIFFRRARARARMVGPCLRGRERGMSPLVPGHPRRNRTAAVTNSERATTTCTRVSATSGHNALVRPRISANGSPNATGSRSCSLVTTASPALRSRTPPCSTVSNPRATSGGTRPPEPGTAVTVARRDSRRPSRRRGRTGRGIPPSGRCAIRARRRARGGPP